MAETDKSMRDESADKKNLDAILEFHNLEQKDWIDRKEAQARAIKLGQNEFLTTETKPN